MSNLSIVRLSGLAFVALLVASAGLFGELLGAFGDPDEVFEDYYSSAANRRGDVAGAYVLTFAGIAFLIFTSVLQASSVANSAVLNRLAAASGVGFAVLLLVAAAALSAVSFSIVFGEAFDDVRPFSNAYAIVPQLGAVLLVVVAPFVASLHIVTIALATRERLSTAVFVASLVCAFALLFSVLYIPQLALPIWVVLVVWKGTSTLPQPEAMSGSNSPAGSRTGASAARPG